MHNKKQAAVQASVTEDKHTEDLRSCLDQLESQLSSSSPYIVEEGLTFADIAIWCRLYVLVAHDTTGR